MAEQQGREEEQEIAAQFCVVPHRSLAMVQERTPRQLIRAQRNVDEDMLNALESMIKAARAGQLEGAAALAQACVTW
jgi:hypothetical protein